MRNALGESFFGLLLSSALIFLSCNAHAQSNTQFCVDGGQCFDSLPQAEAAIEAASLFGSGIELVSKSPSDTGTGPLPQVTYNYKVSFREPETMYPAAYNVAGWSPSQLSCTPSSYPYQSNYYCSDEMEAVEGFYDAMTQGYPGPNCPQGTKTPLEIVNQHDSPFSKIWTGVSRLGQIDFDYTYHFRPYPNYFEQRRRIKFTTQCSSQSGPNNFDLDITKNQAFMCPENFLSNYGDSPTNPAGIGQIKQFPGHLCGPDPSKGPTEFIVRTVVKQVDSCPANANPCHPATGDKSRVESDFEFAGRPFSRFYHSLGETRDGGFGVGWSHTYSERIARNVYGGGQVFYLVNPNGTYEGIVLVSGAVYRLENSSDRTITIQTLSNGSIIFHLRDKDGQTKAFNDFGQLISITDPANPSENVTLTYSGSRLQSVVDAKGRSLQFEYVAELIDRMVLPDGRSISYSYDAFKNLVGVGGGIDQVKQYHYGESGLAPAEFVNHLTGISYAGVRYASFGYDTVGRVISSTLLLDGVTPTETTTLQYVSNTQVVVVENGEQRTYSIQPGRYRRVISIASPQGTESYTYDTLSRMATSTDRRNIVTKYEYPTNLSRIRTDALGTTSQRRIETDLNGPFGLPVQERTYNSANSLVSRSSWTYNTRGQIATATNVDPASSAQRTLTYTYCEQGDVSAGSCPVLGLVTSLDGPRTDVSDVVTYSYYGTDDAGCVISPADCSHRKGDLWKITNPLGHVTETLAYDAAGRPLVVRNANGLVTETTYDANGRTTSRTERGTTSAGDRSVIFDYWPNGLIKKVTQADGSFTSFDYDTASRLTDVSDSSGNTIHYTLNSAGNRTAEATRDENGALTRTLTRVYDQLQRLQSESDAYQHATSYTWDANGNLETVTDPSNSVIDSDYDHLNRLSRTLQDVGGIAADTKYLYDALDNLIRVTDPKGLNTSYTFNGLGDLKQLTSPDTGVSAFTYDSGGNRKTQTDARGIVSTYSYDALNRLIGVVYPTSALNVGHQYDTGNAVCDSGETYALGHLTKTTDGTGSTQYCYTRFGELARKVQTTNGKTFVTRYGHDAAGRLSAVVYPDGAIVDYVRDDEGRVIELGVTAPGGIREVVVTAVSYAPFGPFTGWIYGNGRLMSRTLNQNYQPMSIEDTGAGGLSMGFGFDAVGNLNTLKNAQHTATLAQYSHDALGRLSQVKDGPTGTPLETYTYDDTGNRTSVTRAGTNTNYTYSNSSHRLTKLGKVARTYSASGNLTGNGTQTFIYDDSNRLSQVKNGQVVVANYVYNGNGEQVRSYLATTSNYYVYDEVGHMLGKYDSTGVPIQQVIYLDDLPVGLLQGGGAAQALHYIEPDHIGSPRLIVDGVRNIPIWRWDITGEAFGSTPPHQNPDGDATNTVFDLRFPGQRMDTTTNLHYNYFRDYEASTGRYLQSDPIGLMGDISTYAYVSASPLLSTDSTGLVKWTGRVGFAYGSHPLKLKKRIPIDKLELGGLTLDLVSDCIGGQRIRTSLTGNPAHTGKMDISTSNKLLSLLPVRGAYLKVKVYDDRAQPNSKALEGALRMSVSAGRDATGTISFGEAKGEVTGLSIMPMDVSGEVKLVSTSPPERCTCSP